MPMGRGPLFPAGEVAHKVYFRTLAFQHPCGPALLTVRGLTTSVPAANTACERWSAAGED
ncbi:hypothetical protein GCM10010349_61490 [Streptomyces flavofungini]|nr:hypothetical protein GCM10010349_61490 [Streptomyces flavofungini]